MRVIHGFDNLPPLRGPVVTMGSFDGVHAGHRALLGEVVRLARTSGGESVVVTFSPHPRAVVGDPDAPVQLLNTLEEKTCLLEHLGIDNLLVLPFTEAFSRISSYDFVRDYLIGRLRAATLVVGYDHRFGHNQEGDFDSLDRLRREFGFSVQEVPKQDVGRNEVSSTAIRQRIAEGRMDEAARLLGAPYPLILRRSADGYWQPDPCKLLPPPGIYPARLAAGGNAGPEAAEPPAIGSDCVPSGGRGGRGVWETEASGSRSCGFGVDPEAGKPAMLTLHADRSVSFDDPNGTVGGTKLWATFG